MRELNKLEVNILKYFLYCFVGSFFITGPITFVYFQNELGLTLTQLMLTASFFSIVTAILEIPAGLIGDKFSYKHNLVIGDIGIIFGSLGYALSSRFSHILISEIFWGIGYAFVISALNAFLYQTLHNLNWEHKYTEIKGKGTAFALAGLSISAIIGGFLAKISIRLPLILSPLILILPLIVSISYTEPIRLKPKKEEKVSLIDALSYIASHKNLLFLLLFTLFVSVASVITYSFFQPFLLSLGVDIRFFGIILSISYIFSGVGSIISHKLNRKFKPKQLLFAVAVISFISISILGYIHSLFSLLGILSLWAIDGVRYPLLSDYINRKLKSYNRATINSLVDMTRRIVIAFVLPIMGRIGDTVGLNRVFIINSLILLFGLLLLYPIQETAFQTI